MFGIKGLDIKTNGYVGLPAGDGKRKWLNDVAPTPLPGWLLDAFIDIRGFRAKPAERTPKGERPPRGEIMRSPAEIKRALGVLSQLDPKKYRDQDRWLSLTMSYKAAVGDDEAAADAFIAWSAADPEFANDDITYRYESFDPDGKTTAATFYWFARQDGIKVPYERADAAEDFEPWSEPEPRRPRIILLSMGDMIAYRAPAAAGCGMWGSDRAFAPCCQSLMSRVFAFSSWIVSNWASSSRFLRSIARSISSKTSRSMKSFVSAISRFAKSA